MNSIYMFASSTGLVRRVALRSQPGIAWFRSAVLIRSPFVKSENATWEGLVIKSDSPLKLEIDHHVIFFMVKSPQLLLRVFS